MRQFIGIGYETNGLDLFCLHINGQHGQSSLTGARDKRRLAVHFGQLQARVGQ